MDDIKRARLKRLLRRTMATADMLMQAHEADYAMIGRIFVKYWDRLSDPTPDDPLEKSVAELLRDLQDAQRGHTDQ